MKTKSFLFFIGLLVGMLMLSCAKQQQSNTAAILTEKDDVDLVSHLTGINEKTPVKVDKEEGEETPAEAPQPEQQAEEKSDSDVIGGSQGAFLARLVLNGKETNGKFTVRRATASGDIVKQDIPAGKEIMLDPGTYDFVFTTEEIAGSPELTLRDVEIQAGRRIKRDVKMPVGKITLVTGANCAKKPIRIRAKGATDWYKGKFSTCVEMTLLAGEYEAEMGNEKSGTPISGIQVYDGGVRDILIRNQ